MGLKFFERNLLFLKRKCDHLFHSQMSIQTVRPIINVLFKLESSQT